jgi:hypothetical protein
MKLYHGGLVKVEQPKLLQNAVVRPCDFGSGFYTTTDLDQAKRWSKLRQVRNQAVHGVVSVYEAPDNLFELDGLKRLIFSAPSPEWLDFVMANRTKDTFLHDYDLVIGPVANDRVYATLALFEAEQLSVEETLHRLKTYTLVNQVLFHTDQALKFLRFVDFEEVP